MEIIHREIFGPVLPVVTVDDLDEAIAYANDSDYGLISSLQQTHCVTLRGKGKTGSGRSARQSHGNDRF